MTPVVKISHVLVGVDFDDASASALKTAGALAAARDADITCSMRRRRTCPPVSQRPRSTCLKPNASRLRQAPPTSCVCLPSGTLGVTFAWWLGKGRRKTPCLEWLPRSI